MNDSGNGKSRKWIFVIAVLLLVAGVAWWQQTRILTWYYVRNLVAAPKQSRDRWVERVAKLDAVVLPSLLEHLHGGDAQACDNVEAALVALATRWGVDDERSLKLTTRLHHEFPGYNEMGQCSALQTPIALLQTKNDEAPPIPATLALAVGNLLTESAKRDDAAVRERTLILASLLLDRVPKGQWGDTCRNLLTTSLNDKSPRNRVLAIHLALRPAFRKNKRVIALLVPLLRDKSAEVRRAALVAVGASQEMAADDDLLPLLHDPDEQVRELCETALRSRGLQDHHLVLAKLVTDAQPITRLEVFEHLRHAEDLDPAMWLRRLSHDASPAVRAAAIRETTAHPDVDLRDRVVEMAQTDPSATVRELARFYLKQIKSR